VPENWLVSRVCDEFHCVPSVAVQELTGDPERRVVSILEMRGYARTKAAIDAAQKPEDVPTGPMATCVKRVMDAWLHERTAGGE
jgi:hypothetical protein